MSTFISSRTPEGVPNHCPVCDALLYIEPSKPLGDAPCPNCGALLWFLQTSSGVRLYEREAVATIRERVVVFLAARLGVFQEDLTDSSSFADLGIDSLDLVELVMEFEVQIPDTEAEQIRAVGDLIDWLLRHLR